MNTLITLKQANMTSSNILSMSHSFPLAKNGRKRNKGGGGEVPLLEDEHNPAGKQSTVKSGRNNLPPEINQNTFESDKQQI